MSQRTIAEFNHDYAAEIKDRPEDFMLHLRMALNGGDKEFWDTLERCYGLRRVVQCHHSDDRKVVVRDHEYSVG